MRALAIVSGLVMVVIVGAAAVLANHRGAVVQEAGHEHGWTEHHHDVPGGGMMGPEMMGPDVHGPEEMGMPSEPPGATAEDEEEGPGGEHHHHETDDHHHH